MNKRLRFFEKDTVDWKGPSLANFYRAMFELKEQQEALDNGAWGGDQVPLKNNGGDRIYAFTRTKGASTVLVMVNFADTAARVSYAGLPVTGDYTDWFSKAAVPLGAAGRIAVPAHGYRVLVKR